ncbi:MAG: polymer-forming cytoskeletal protein, partial [Ruminococcus sp.]|nr:polymer-forming cytoskeletal protein [Ruminococcus sp.]
MNPNETSRIGGNTSSKLYAWSASVVNQTESSIANPHTTASIYSLNKELILNNMTVSGDVRANKDCTIQGNVTIDGDLVVGGTLKIESGANLTINGELYCNTGSIVKNGTVNKAATYNAVPTHYHAPVYDPSIHIEIVNAQRKYLTVNATPKPDNNWAGINDEWIWSSPDNPITQVHYKWKEDFNPDNCDGYKFSDYTDINEWNANGIDIKKWIGKYYYTKQNGETDIEINFDGAMDYYTVETYYDLSSGDEWSESKPTNRESFLIYKDGSGEVAGYYTLPKADGSDSGWKMSDLDSSLGYSANDTAVWYKKDDTLVSKSEGDASVGAELTGLPIADYTSSHGKIYPEYAERDVILGLKQVGSTPIEQTKIVKTFKEVLEKVANPYKEGTLSVELSKQHDELIAALSDETKKSKVYFENYEDILKAYNVYADDIQADGSYTEATPVFTGADTDTFAGGYNHIDTEGLLIKDDCILNIPENPVWPQKGLGKADCLVFDPGTKDILVIVNSLDLDGQKIIVNDSQGGTVNFFIEKKDGSGGVMKLHTSENFVAPTSYMKAFADSTSDTMSYGNVDKGGLDLNKLGKPHINIYGAPGTELISTESGGFIANIVSSELKFTSSAGTKMSCANNISKIYYNGNEVSNSNNPFIIGCINSSFADVPNGLNVLFVTDSSTDDPDPVGIGEDAFNYRILYYDEY